jgi:hypothetical protein
LMGQLVLPVSIPGAPVWRLARRAEWLARWLRRSRRLLPRPGR